MGITQTGGARAVDLAKLHAIDASAAEINLLVGKNADSFGNITKILSASASGTEQQIDLTVGNISAYRELILIINNISLTGAGQTHLRLNNNSNSGDYLYNAMSGAATYQITFASIANSRKAVLQHIILSTNQIYGYGFQGDPASSFASYFSANSSIINTSNLVTINIVSTTGGSYLGNGTTIELYGVRK